MRLIIFPALFFTLIFCIPAQTKVAQKVDEFGDMNCEEILSRTDGMIGDLNKDPESKAFIIFYEGRHSEWFYDKKTKKSDFRAVDPRRGEAENKTKAITLYATKWRKIPKERFVIINGGYNTNYGVELWIVPFGAQPPKPSPELSEKDIKFRKGKPYRVRDCQKIYSDI
jgi:hypothetical protein